MIELNTIIDVASYRSVLCLNGTLPQQSFFEALSLPIIAADGAVNTLMKMEITPEVVVGDLDSIDPMYLETLRVHHHEDQNYCDFQKSLQYLEKNALLPSVILGMNGGFLDHIINNLSVFIQSDHVFYAPPLLGCIIRSGCTKSFTLPHDTKLSLFGMPAARVTTSGLKWELQDLQLTFPGMNSSFNRSVTPSVSITVDEGVVLMLIYLQHEK